MEIEDTILAELQRKATTELPAAKAFEQIFDKIGKSKDRNALLKLVKEHFPETVIPEIDAAKPVYDEIEKLRAELTEEKEARAKDHEEREKAAQEAAAKRTIAEERRALREAGFDDEGVEKVEEYMRQTGNPDYKSAAAYVRTQITPDAPLPSTFAGQRYNWFTPPDDAPDHKTLLKNPKAFQDAEIAKWLRERRGRAA